MQHIGFVNCSLVGNTQLVGAHQKHTNVVRVWLVASGGAQAKVAFHSQSVNVAGTPSDAVWGTPTGNVVTITSALAGLPAFTAGDIINIQDHSNAANNGLYQETGGSPTTSSITVTKLTGTLPPAAAAAEAVTMAKTTPISPTFSLANAEKFQLEGSKDVPIFQSTRGEKFCLSIDSPTAVGCFFGYHVSL